jgi:nanoRNase/pAp phosphatase (c-di-AMP/oligoRNAs hydrolase)
MDRPDTKKMTEKLARKAPLLEKIHQADLSRVFIGLGAGVDPDGLACQAAMARIVLDINPDAEIFLYYRGDWDRAQNRTMREVLGLNPKPYSEIKDNNYSCAIMVDGNVSCMPPGIEPNFVIDHHEGTAGGKDGYDVRLIGSCSAIMWEYIMEQNSELLEGEDGAILATALAIGITTDTDGMTAAKTSRLDWEAYSYCGMRGDVKAYAAIKNYPKPAYQKDIETQAWTDKTIEGTVLVTPLGLLTTERKGALSSCSEEFCGQGPVKTTLAAADIDGDIHFSVRTFNSSMNVNDFIKKILTKFGGGKPGAGAGVIKMPEVFKGLPDELREEIFTVLFKAIAHKTFEYCGDGVRIKKETT